MLCSQCGVDHLEEGSAPVPNYMCRGAMWQELERMKDAYAVSQNTLIGAKIEIETLKSQIGELIGWLRDVHSLAMIHDLAPSLARDIRAISGQVAKYVEKLPNPVSINEQCWCAAKAEAKDAKCPIHD